MGKSSVCKLLLKHGADARMADKFGLTAIHHAALAGHKDVVVRLGPAPVHQVEFFFTVTVDVQLLFYRDLGTLTAVLVDGAGAPPLSSQGAQRGRQVQRDSRPAR